MANISKTLLPQETDIMAQKAESYVVKCLFVMFVELAEAAWVASD